MSPLQASAKDEALFITDPRIIAIPIAENNDPLFDLKSQNIIKFGPSPEIPNNTEYTKMRQSVYDKLIEAQSMLPNGLNFCLYEALRSISLQEKLFTERYSKVKNSNPTWNDHELFLDGALSVTNSTKISIEAQENRKIMNAVLSKVGFVNYATEYWHWSYGDRYWAYYKDEPYALYGSV